MSEINFAVWAPDEKTFWDSWEAAGIVTSDVDEEGNPTGTYTFTSEYPGIIISSQSDQGWVPERETGNVITGEDGSERPEKEPVPGWHCNVKVVGPLVSEMTYGLDQTDDDGKLLDVFQRTWATMIFQLEWRDADMATGFPAGYRNETGVCYCDISSIKSPSNVWL